MQQPHQQHLGRAAIYQILASLSFAFMLVFLSFAGDLPVMQKVFFRNTIVLATTFFMMPNKSELWGRPENRILLLVRGLVGSLGVVLNFYGVDRMVLADGVMLTKLSPFFIAVFALFFLKERLPRLYALCLGLALGGAVLVIRPGFVSDLGPSVAVIVASLCTGIAYTLVRQLGRTENFRTIIFHFSLVGSITSLPFLFIDWVWPTPLQLLWLVLMGLAASGGQSLMTKAYQHAPAAQVAVFDYSQIVFALVLGLLLMGQEADLFTLGGAALITLAGILLYIFNHRIRDAKVKS